MFGFILDFSVRGVIKIMDKNDIKNADNLEGIFNIIPHIPPAKAE